MSRRHATLDGGEGFYWCLVGLWLLLCWLAKGTAWLFCLGMSHAQKVAEPSGPPPGYVPRSRAAPSFESYSAYCDEVLSERVPEPSITHPEMLGDADEVREYRATHVERDPDGTITLRVTEPSRYRRKLIPPGSCNRDD